MNVSLNQILCNHMHVFSARSSVEISAHFWACKHLPGRPKHPQNGNSVLPERWRIGLAWWMPAVVPGYSQNFPFPGSFLLCQLVSRGNEFFWATVLTLYSSAAYLRSQVESTRRFEEHNCLLHIFFHFVPVFYQAPISMMGFGILWPSMPGGIALLWRWITMLPLPAMQPLSQGSTLGTATILEVGCFREVFVMQILWCSPLSSP